MDIRYAAGIVDGEGSIAVWRATNRTYQADVSITNTYLPLLEAFHVQYGGKPPRVANKWTTRPNWKVLYRWNLPGQTALAFLKSIEPHLIVKREQAILTIEFLENLSPGRGGKLSPDQWTRRDQIVDRMKALNTRGRAAATTERRDAEDIRDATV